MVCYVVLVFAHFAECVESIDKISVTVGGLSVTVGARSVISDEHFAIVDVCPVIVVQVL